MSEPRQSYANHSRLDPWFHFGIAPMLLICFLFSIYLGIREPSLVHAWLCLLTLAVLMLALLCRVYGLKVQDRVIRLEERLRLAALLPEAQRSRISELSERQLIALRFASDDELPALFRRTLQEGLEPKAIKKAIESWKPDHWRV